MHTYIKSNQGNGNYLYTVGFELPAEQGYRNFRPIQDFNEESDAACFAAFLNGGQPPIGVLKRIWPKWNY